MIGQGRLECMKKGGKGVCTGKRWVVNELVNFNKRVWWGREAKKGGKNRIKLRQLEMDKAQQKWSFRHAR